MDKLPHYQALRSRLDKQWTHLLTPVDYKFYDPYSTPGSNQTSGQNYLYKMALDGFPIPQIIPGYAFYTDRGEKTAGKETFSLGCQTDRNETVDTVALLKDQLEWKIKQHKEIDQVAKVQHERMEWLEEQLKLARKYIENHKVIEAGIFRVQKDQELADHCATVFLKTAVSQQTLERELVKLVNRKTCSNCRTRIQPKFMTKRVPSSVKRAVQKKNEKHWEEYMKNVEENKEQQEQREEKEKEALKEEHKKKQIERLKAVTLKKQQQAQLEAQLAKEKHEKAAQNGKPRALQRAEKPKPQPKPKPIPMPVQKARARETKKTKSNINLALVPFMNQNNKKKKK